MTLFDAATLLAAMVALALTPSVSVLAVAARTVSHGLGHGILVALGIVLVDVLFVLVAAFGLALLLASIGEGFAVLKAIGGIYLLVVGAALWRQPAPASPVPTGPTASAASSFLAGVMITLADQKALLFYLGFLPAFIDLQTLSIRDVVALIAITVVSVGGVKLGYAWLAHRAGRVAGARAARPLNRLASAVMAAVGAYLLLTAVLKAAPGIFFPH